MDLNLSTLTKKPSLDFISMGLPNLIISFLPALFNLSIAGPFLLSSNSSGETTVFSTSLILTPEESFVESESESEAIGSTSNSLISASLISATGGTTSYISSSKSTSSTCSTLSECKAGS